MIDPIAVRLGPFAIHWYAICILSGLLLAVYLTSKEAPRKKIKPDDVIDFILIAFPLAILGARLYYVIFQWSYYAQHPMEIFAVWEGGLAIYGGLIVGTIVLFSFSYYRMIKPLDFLDIAAPGVMIAQSIGRWGNFINQEAYGAAVKSLDYLPGFIKQQMYIEGSYRQPTFLFESLWNLLGFAIISLLRRQPRFLKEGEVISFYLVWYGAGRFVIEGMRTDSLMLGGLRVSQWLSIVLVVAGLLIIILRRRRPNIPYYLESSSSSQ
ncbi:prolipoprotein diacylglyceryl transferase [Streptococcus fryi]